MSKWIGHNAYIEVIDDGDGYLAVERILFADGPPPAAPAAPQSNPLVARMLADPAIDSPTALARAYRQAFVAALDAWLKQSSPARTKSVSLAGSGQGEGLQATADIVNWLLRKHSPSVRSSGPSTRRPSWLAWPSSTAAVRSSKPACGLRGGRWPWPTVRARTSTCSYAAITNCSARKCPAACSKSSRVATSPRSRKAADAWNWPGE